MTIKEKFFGFAQQDRVARLLLEQIRPLHRHLKETTLEEIEGWIEQEQLPLDRGDIIRAVRAMDELGVARFIVGRRGAASRIEWILDTGDLGEGTRADAEEPEEDAAKTQFKPAGLDIHRLASARAQEAQAGSEAGSEVLEHSFRVRPSFPITFELPADFSPAEAERLSAFIKSLPF